MQPRVWKPKQKSSCFPDNEGDKMICLFMSPFYLLHAHASST
jgi:hypothetical protein